MRAVRAGGVLAEVVAVLEMVRRRFARRYCCVSFTARWCGSQRLGCSNSCRNVAGHGGFWLGAVAGKMEE